RQQIHSRKRRTQRIIAWKSKDAAAALPSKEELLRNLLAVERGPLPLSQLLRLAADSRAFVERLLRGDKLERWEEAPDPADDPYDTGYTPPAHTLHPEQAQAFGATRARF